MDRIFISYRREDSEGFARSLFQSLSEEFGSDTVFMDVEAIELGVDFIDVIDKTLETCGAFLVLIGKEWASCTDASGKKRIENPDDFVRLEVATALKRNVRVIPILVKGAKMPKTEDLPEDLQPITRRQALELRHDQWKYDVEHLINALEKCLDLHHIEHGTGISKDTVHETEDKISTTKPTLKVKRAVVTKITIAVAIVLFIAIGIWSFYNFFKPPEKIIPSPKGDISKVVPEYKIRKVQEALAKLGYDPGFVDGQIGPRTIVALKSFQSEMGLDANGEITDEIIQILVDAVRKQTGFKSQKPRPRAAINLTGVWFDEDKIAYEISQTGNTFEVQALDPMMGYVIFSAAGTINGRELEYYFKLITGEQGVGRGNISSDNRYINYTSIDSSTGMMESGRLYRQMSR